MSEIVTHKPLRADARRNRQRILDAARDAFTAHGADVQIDQIAEAAGVGVGTLYRHFPTKEALLGSLVKERFAAMVAGAREVVAREGRAFDLLAEILRHDLGLMTADLGVQHALMRLGEDVWREADPEKAELQSLVAPLLERAKEEGDLRADFEVAEIGMLMCGICSAMGPGRPPEWRWSRHLEIVLDGLRAR